jgi:hypothetical protein
VGGEWATCGGDRCTCAVLSARRGARFGVFSSSWSCPQLDSSRSTRLPGGTGYRVSRLFISGEWRGILSGHLQRGRLDPTPGSNSRPLSPIPVQARDLPLRRRKKRRRRSSKILTDALIFGEAGATQAQREKYHTLLLQQTQRTRRKIRRIGRHGKLPIASPLTLAGDNREHGHDQQLEAVSVFGRKRGFAMG